MDGPKANSMRRAISGVSADLPWRRSESVARRTLRMADALEMERPSGSDSGERCGGHFGGIFMLSYQAERFALEDPVAQHQANEVCEYPASASSQTGACTRV